jgi:hypothetical protein
MANPLEGARERARQNVITIKENTPGEHNEPGEFGPGVARATFINFYESLAIIYS